MATKALAAALLFLLVACQTPSGDFCEVAEPVRPSAVTLKAMSDDEVAEALRHNRLLEELCGVKP